MATRKKTKNSSNSRVSSRYDEALSKLQAMSENDLINNVIKPLFLAMGFSKVEFKGGPHEHGQDLVCFGEGRLGGDEILVAQVKKYKPTARASDKHSLSEIVTQLSQAIETPVPTTDTRQATSDRDLLRDALSCRDTLT